MGQNMEIKWLYRVNLPVQRKTDTEIPPGFLENIQSLIFIFFLYNFSQAFCSPLPRGKGNQVSLQRILSTLEA